MNVLMVSHQKRGMFQGIHPSDPLWLIMKSYEAAMEGMKYEVPYSVDVYNAMYDLITLMPDNYADIKRYNLAEVELILFRNGFDFINQFEIRENSSQDYLGGEIIGI